MPRTYEEPVVRVHFIPRKVFRGCPAGLTVSKSLKLPKGDFKITEYHWGDTSLWFVDRDKFTADERQACYLRFMEKMRKVA